MTIIKLLGFIALLGVLVPLALVPPSTLLAHLLPWIQKVLDVVWGFVAFLFRILGRFWAWAGDRVEGFSDSLKNKTAGRLGEPEFGVWMLVRPLIEAVVAVVLGIAYAIFLADTLATARIGNGTVSGGAPVLFAAIFANTVGLWKFGEALWGEPPVDSPSPPRRVGLVGFIALIVFDVSLGIITVMTQNGFEPSWATVIPRVAFLVMLVMATVIVGMRIPRIVDALAIIGFGISRIVMRFLEVGAQIVVFALDFIRKVILMMLAVAAAIGRGAWNWATKTNFGKRLGINPIEELEVEDLVEIIDPLIDKLLPFLAPHPTPAPPAPPGPLALAS